MQHLQNDELGDASLSHTYSIFPSKNILLLLSVFRCSLQDMSLLYKVLCTDGSFSPPVTQSHDMLVLCGWAGIWAYITPGLSVELTSPNMKKTCQPTTVSLLCAILRDHTHLKGGHAKIQSHVSSNPAHVPTSGQKTYRQHQRLSSADISAGNSMEVVTGSRVLTSFILFCYNAALPYANVPELSDQSGIRKC